MGADAHIADPLWTDAASVQRRLESKRTHVTTRAERERMEKPRRKHAITVNIDPDDIDHLDLYARSMNRSRSALVQMAVTRLLLDLETGS